jgi:hypothetical protein
MAGLKGNIKIRNIIRPLAQMQNLPSSPNPFSQLWEKGSQFQVPLPSLGEGFRVRAFNSCKKSIVDIYVC